MKTSRIAARATKQTQAAKLASQHVTEAVREIERAGPRYASLVDQVLRLKVSVLHLLHTDEDDKHMM